MIASFKIKSGDLRAVYYCSITLNKKDSVPYDIKIIGREIYKTEVSEEIKALRADKDMIVEVKTIKEAEVVEQNQPPSRPMTESEKKAESEKK